MANTYVTKAVAGGVFTGNDDNVWVQMGRAEPMDGSTGFPGHFIPVMADNPLTSVKPW